MKRLLTHIPNIRIGVMAQGDYCDWYNYVLKYVDLTKDVDKLVSFVQDVPATSGGDTPEVPFRSVFFVAFIGPTPKTNCFLIIFI